MAARGGLGKGLDALIPSSATVSKGSSSNKSIDAKEEIKKHLDKKGYETIDCGVLCNKRY